LPEEEEKNELGNRTDEDKRTFIKVALTASALLAAGGVAVIAKSITNSQSGVTGPALSFPRVKIGTVSQLQTNEAVLFNYPLEETPNYLIKLGTKAPGGVGPDSDIVAYSQLCQHLGCNYSFQAPRTSPKCNGAYVASSPVGYCCCHGSVYDLVNGGKVIGGPSPRPLPMVLLDVDPSGDIYAIGMTPPTIFGHNTGSNDVSADLQGGTPVT